MKRQPLCWNAGNYKCSIEVMNYFQNFVCYLLRLFCKRLVLYLCIFSVKPTSNYKNKQTRKYMYLYPFSTKSIRSGYLFFNVSTCISMSVNFPPGGSDSALYIVTHYKSNCYPKESRLTPSRISAAVNAWSLRFVERVFAMLGISFEEEATFCFFLAGYSTLIWFYSQSFTCCTCSELLLSI